MKKNLIPTSRDPIICQITDASFNMALDLESCNVCVMQHFLKAHFGAGMTHTFSVPPQR